MTGSQVGNLAKELISHGADKLLYAISPLLNNYANDGYTTVIVDLIEEKTVNSIMWSFFSRKRLSL
ncbi:hypothetical protein [Clostridium sp.]